MKLVESMPRRVAAVITAKGEITKYQTFNQLDLALVLMNNNGFWEFLSFGEDPCNC